MESLVINEVKRNGVGDAFKVPAAAVVGCPLLVSVAARWRSYSIRTRINPMRGVAVMMRFLLLFYCSVSIWPNRRCGQGQSCQHRLVGKVALPGEDATEVRGFCIICVQLCHCPVGRMDGSIMAWFACLNRVLARK